jgi:hypothetical protein
VYPISPSIGKKRVEETPLGNPYPPPANRAEGERAQINGSTGKQKAKNKHVNMYIISKFARVLHSLCKTKKAVKDRKKKGTHFLLRFKSIDPGPRYPSYFTKYILRRQCT